MDSKNFRLLSKSATAAEMAFLVQLDGDDSYAAQSLYKEVARYIFDKSLDRK